MAKKTTTTTTTKKKTTTASKKAGAPAKSAAAKKRAPAKPAAKKSSTTARKSPKAARGAAMGKIAVITAIAACAVVVVFFFFKFFDVSLAGNSAASVNVMQAAPGGGDSGDTIAPTPGPTSGLDNWTAVADSTFGNSLISAVAWGNNRFVAGGKNGSMAYSVDGASWTAVADSGMDVQYEGRTYKRDISAIAWGNGRFVAVSWTGEIAYADW